MAAAAIARFQVEWNPVGRPEISPNLDEFGHKTDPYFC
jgi:hypothetical protein